MNEMKTNSVFCCVMMMAMVWVVMLVSSSCAPRRMLAEQVVVHDTLRETHTDTMRLDTHHSHTDTVRESRVQVITLRQDSDRTDTVRIETTHERWHTVYVTDSVNAFRHLADSLQAVLKSQAVREVTVPLRHSMLRFALITLFSVMVVVAISMIVRRRRHSRFEV